MDGEEGLGLAGEAYDMEVLGTILRSFMPDAETRLR